MMSYNAIKNQLISEFLPQRFAVLEKIYETAERVSSWLC